MSDLYPKFRNKKGQHTRYAMACGYVQTYIRNEIETTMWHEGGTCYHVKTIDRNMHERLAWDVADTLTEARKIFSSHKRLFKR